MQKPVKLKKWGPHASAVLGVFGDRQAMSAKAAARKASKRARREQEVIMGPAVPAGTGVRRGPPVAPTSGLLSGSVVNDEWQTVRRSWFDLHAIQLRPHPCSSNFGRILCTHAY